MIGARTLAFLLLILAALSPALAQPIGGTYVSIEKASVTLGELAIIHVDPHPQRLVALTITDGSNTFRFSGPQAGSIGFQPQRTGEHALLVKDRETGELLETLHFLVQEQSNSTIVPIDAINTSQDAADIPGADAETVLPTRTRLITSDKQNYLLGEPVRIMLLAEDTSSLRLNVVFNNEVFRFLGDLDQSTLFHPQHAGSYRVVVSGTQGAAIDSFVFTVTDPAESVPAGAQSSASVAEQSTAADELTRAVEQTPQRFKIKNARKQVLNGTVRITPEGSADVLSASILEAQQLQLQGPAMAEFIPADGPIKNVRIHRLAGQLDLGLDLFSDTPVELPFAADTKRAAWTSLYAVDPTKLNDSNVTLTVTATGTELYTCKDWDYTNRACLGAWVKIRDVTPGENYTITLDPTDPGFGETISIPTGGYTEVDAGTTFTIRLCADQYCQNTSTIYNRGDTVYVQVNASPSWIRTTAKNQFDIYAGEDTGSILSVIYNQCIGTTPDGPYTSCKANFTIDVNWADGWYYIDSEQIRVQGGGVYTSFRTAFIVGSEPVQGESLKFFADSAYTRQTEIFPAGTQMYVEFNVTPLGTASATNTAPRIRNIKTISGTGGTVVTETWSNTNGPYRFNFSMPTLASSGWYYLEPLLRNATNGAIPAGASVHGRMFLYQANTVPSIRNVSTNSPIGNPRSVGQMINWTVAINDTDEVDQWTIFICSTNSFNSASRSCTAATTCANATFSRQLNRTCYATATSAMNATNQNYAFVCDARNCSTGRQINWSVYNDTTRPTISLITPVNDPAGSLPRNTHATTFNFVPADDYGLTNCTLYTNATGAFSAATTNTTITNGTNNYLSYTFSKDGAYLWNVQCSDAAGNKQFAPANYTVVIIGPPIVWLTSPANSTYTSAYLSTFSYNVSYGQNISNCSLIVNGSINATDYNVTLGAAESITHTFSSDGSYSWNIYCVGIDGTGAYGDGVLSAGTDRLLYIDTQAPNVTLSSPADLATVTTSSVDFVYRANDTGAVKNCTLSVDGVTINTISNVPNNVDQTVPFLLNNGDHPWYVTCADAAGNTVQSATRTVTVNSASSGSAQYYETNYVAATPTPPANINLSTTVDGSEEGMLASVPSTTMQIMSRAITTPFQGNGIIVNANTTVNFSAMFSAARVNTGYITWKLFKSNSTADVIIAQSGDDSTGGALITTTAKAAYARAVSSPIAPVRILGTEWVKLQVDVYNGDGRRRAFTHYIDNRSSYVMFNFTRLGVLTTDITSPAVNLTVGMNDTFLVVCSYNCSGGACLNTKIYVERNSSATGWQAVPSSGGVLILNGTETNPHTFPVVAFPGGTTSFVLKANTTGVSKVRCNATSDYSSALITDTVTITVGTQSVPTIALLSPANNSYISTAGLNFSYLVSSSRNIANCSLLLNGVRNQTNTTIVKDVPNRFIIGAIAEASYNWSVTCTDQNGIIGNSSQYIFRIDRGPPTISLNSPGNNTNFTTDTIRFNWTAADTVDAAAGCNLTIDGTVRSAGVSSPSNTPTAATVGGLTIGVHLWNVTCVDDAGNRNTSATWMFNITNLPNNVTLLAPPTGTWNNSAAVLLFYNVTHPANWQPANCSLYLNGTLNQANSTTIRLNQSNNFSISLPEGHYSWYVQCVQPDGVQNTSQSRIIYLDRTQPFINLTYPPNASTLSIFNIPFSFNATDGLAPNMTCSLSLDNTINRTGITSLNGKGSTATVNNIADGLHNWSVTCIDPAGNTNISQIFEFSAIAPPVVTLYNPPNNGYNNTPNLTLVFNVSENNQIANCTLYFDGTFASNNQTPVNNNALNSFSANDTAEGRHTWSVSCADVSGYVGSSATFNVTVDYTKPAIILNAPPNASLLRSPVATLNWTIIDNIDTSILCNVTRVGPDGTDRTKNNIASANNSSTTTTYSGLPDGLHLWNVTCIDDAKNVNYSTTFQFNISALPSVTLVAPQNNNINNSPNVTFAYVPLQSYGIADCTLIVNGMPNRTNYSISNGITNYFYLTDASSGTYNWSVNCTDNTGGMQNSSTWRFTIDSSSPSITLNAPADASVQANNTVAFNYTPVDTQSSSLVCNLSINGSIYSPNQAVPNATAQVTSVTLRGGNASYLWNVTCRDSAHNRNTSESRTFNIIAPPVVRLVFPLDNSGTSPNTTFVFYAADPFGVQNCSLLIDGVVVNSTTSVMNYSNNNLSTINIAPGEHSWTVTCYDVDNDTYTPAPFSLSSDVMPPLVFLNAPPQGAVFSVSTVTFNWTAVEDIALNTTCTLYLDGINRSQLLTPNNTPTTATLTSIRDGLQDWNVTCRDLVGNTNTSETRQVTINQTPTIALGAPANNALTNNGTVMFTFTPSDNEGFTNCSLLVNGAQHTANQSPVRNGVLNNITVALSTANYNWSITCFDNGTFRLQNTTTQRALTVNLIKPVIALNSPPPAFITNASAVVFNWTATETFGGVLSCNVTINGTTRASGINSPSGVATTTTITGLNDSYQVWNVSCIDPAGNTNTSGTQDFSITAPPLVLLISPSNGLRTNASAMSFNFTPSDNSGLLGACSLVLNGVVNATITTPQSGVSTNISVIGLGNNTYNWSVNCTDRFANQNTSQSRLLYIDQYPPVITLISPGNNTATGTNVTFNWTAGDAGTSVTCNLTLDGVVNASDIASVPGAPMSRLVPNIAQGSHTWNVTCWDDLMQKNVSLTYVFTVNAADLVLNTTSRVWLNNTNPNENDTIRISANVSNFGGVPANNAVISFWDGIPGSGGVFIGNATATIQPNESRIVNVSWNITPGLHTIVVIADQSDAIYEDHETNNNVSIQFSLLRVLLNAPQNNTVTNDQTPDVNFTIQNFTGGTFDYTVFVDGAANGQSATAQDNQSVLLTLGSLSQGVHRIIIQGSDGSRAKNSTPLWIVIDLTPPNNTILTLNGTYYRQAPLNISVRITDNFDALINYTLFVNGAANVSGSMANATTENITIHGLINGTYTLVLEGTDDAGNRANSTPVTIVVDSVAPSISLDSPANGATLYSRAVNLTYTPTDNIDTLLQCNLTIDNTVLASYANVTNGSASTSTASGLVEGAHQWNATCWDGLNSINQVNNVGVSATYTFSVIIPPAVTLISPPNNTLSNNQTQVFLFNVTEETGLANCSLYLNGALNATKAGAQLTINSTNNFTISGLNNTILWSVMCVDTTIANAATISENRTLIIDMVAPLPVINTANGTWFRNSTPSINITITDNYDSVLNWTIYVDGATNSAATVANGTATLVSLSGLANGSHTIILQALDDARNYANSSAITIFVDTAAPLVTLQSPENNTNLSSTTAVLNFTATDNLATTLACNLTLDGTVVAQYNLTNGTIASYTAANLLSGYHYWNATCIDTAANRGTSATWRFFVELPDLVITAGNITLSNATPIENQTVIVNATIYNIGLLDVAGNFTAQFWLGDPATGGKSLANFSIPGLNASENVTISISHAAVIGLNQLYVILDPPLATNGTIVELNESNNKAHADFWVGLFEVFAGTHQGDLHISDSSVIAAFTWNQSEVTGSNVFVADSESTISFTSLQAIGRNTTNGTSIGTSDFEEIDIRINSASLNDSINLTFTTSGGPLGLMNITAFKRRIENIPIINSTNTESFRTGILWDMSDGGRYYNASQDIVFVTVMNQSQAGRYGTYDYEIAVPATLRDYIPGGGTVTFYTELR